MNEPTMTTQTESKTNAGRIARMILQWTILGLLAFTCLMAAIRKFGG